MSYLNLNRDRISRFLVELQRQSQTDGKDSYNKIMSEYSDDESDGVVKIIKYSDLQYRLKLLAIDLWSV